MAPRLAPRCLQLLRPRLQPQFITPPTSSSLSPSSSCISGNVALLLPRISQRGVKSGWSTLKPRDAHQARYNQAPGLPELSAGPDAALARKEKTTPLRTGVLAVKKGMTSVFVGKKRVPATVLQLDQVQVVATRHREKHGYWAVQVGLGQKEPRNVTRPLLGYFEAKGVYPKRHLAEFRVRNEEGLLPVGVQLLPDWFQKGQYVDVRSNSRGMGFAGGMKRWGFAGQGASHGNSLNHRTMGTAGPSQGSGSRVMPGKKMPGRMGNERVTVQNLTVLQVDNELGIVIVSGPVAGPKGCVVQLQDAVKRKPPAMPYREAKLVELLENNKDAEAKLQEARERHLAMKEQRRAKVELA
ncbi:54S ribosomal protein L9 [Sodiomyces alkalinus F11]|uniref:Large ribosomal subunit protein uL3m n=1 Tax=Sodiomyces alkalinus (strain CBS 110278 / VKM F-3762 / F11) TaxID=1314773 RepID=A0A3N2Q0F7_SODAK|nr:54S ribosomal protein L9 [Sodiomyces alkalinus F11]ROT40251.1 54S ribosomal protein L9 [Sodiomyces alkalinus F11]